MKVTRTKSGVSIRINDAEFEALKALVEHGQGDMEGTTIEDAFPELSKAALGAMRGRLSDQNPLRIDADLRPTPASPDPARKP